ncbi:MAG: dihydrofolate reductase [Halorubrum sp.]
MRLVSVAAVAANGVIGDDGGVPWPHLPADVEQYRERVAGSPVILGRRTFESMRAALPGSHQIVVSRSVDAVDEPTVTVVSSVEAALDAAREIVDDTTGGSGAPHDDTVYVLGGGTIYESLQPHVDGMALSHVDGVYDGDTRFPEFDEHEWRVVAETDYDGFTLREWRRAAGD